MLSWKCQNVAKFSKELLTEIQVSLGDRYEDEFCDVAPRILVDIYRRFRVAVEAETSINIYHKIARLIGCLYVLILSLILVKKHERV